MATNPKNNKEKKPGIFQWLIVILAPLLLASIIAVIIMAVMGVDVSKHTKEALNKIPFISEYVTTDEEELHANQLADRDHQISMLEEEVESLQADNQLKDSTIAELEEEVATMSEQATEVDEEETTETSGTTSDSVKEISKSFAAMKPKEAAPIIETMENDVAIPLLREIKADERGKILAEMDPEVAANLADILAND
ncbi:hypothetical protein SH601_13175 [Gracilibacillus sp. S3-1-1]|uniref:Uncharacterized protein n=1 Tax=Gracilibacillus pellucidus TaxID=3095368 RepID=A0ACC6M7K4_9BACI|nr:hypothetical protein [Gracilibacillus sp. S3-1-1]MDX8046939.1 hypothetical protein [Gracilibacillus sp. S3-1-1]